MTKLIKMLKYSLLPAVALAVLALGLGSVTSDPRPAAAEPLQVTALNDALCVALGSAFGGVNTVVAKFNCENDNQQAPLQVLAACLAKTAGVACGAEPGPNSIHLRPTPELFAPLDRDLNQVFAQQTYSIIAFVNDDFPVRFIANKGEFLDPFQNPAGQDLFCAPDSTQYTPTSLDPDCDGNSATVGDGVVVAKFQTLLSDGDEGTVHINVIQENTAFPVDLTITGTPKTITLTPLFGKDTIQTGATPATPADEADCIAGSQPGLCQEPDTQDCNFAASVEGVLAAVGQAEKTIIVARALDNNDVQVVGALISWYIQNDGYPPYPAPPNGGFGAELFGASPATTPNRYRQGGVALPQTPTIDLGASLGVGFVQFVCGGRKPGTLTFDTNFDPILASLSSLSEHALIDINVVGPATDVTLTAEPAAIDCNGTNSSTVTANVVNAAGDPVANGLDAQWSVVALGTANPLTGDLTAGVGTTVVTPLASAGGVTGDGQPRGVTVTVSVKGQISETDFLTSDDTSSVPHQTYEYVERSILVQCTGGPPPPGTGGAPAGAGSGPATGSIRPPDTGSAGIATGTLGWSMLAALVAAGFALGSVGLATRRK